VSIKQLNIPWGILRRSYDLGGNKNLLKGGAGVSPYGDKGGGVFYTSQTSDEDLY